MNLLVWMKTVTAEAVSLALLSFSAQRVTKKATDPFNSLYPEIVTRKDREAVIDFFARLTLYRREARCDFPHYLHFTSLLVLPAIPGPPPAR